VDTGRGLKLNLRVSPVHSRVSVVILRQAQDDKHGGIEITETHGEIKPGWETLPADVEVFLMEIP